MRPGAPPRVKRPGRGRGGDPQPSAGAECIRIGTAGGSPAPVLEELDGPVVPLGRGTRGKRAEVPAPSGSRVELPGVQPVLPRAQLPDHDSPFRAARAFGLMHGVMQEPITRPWRAARSGVLLPCLLLVALPAAASV